MIGRIIFSTVIIVVLGLGLAYMYLTISTKNQREQILQLEKSISHLKEETVPVRFKVLDNENNEIKVAIKFYDMDGKVIKKMEETLTGNELCFDFFVFPLKDKYLAFPNKIYTNEIAPKDGISLMNEYNMDGFPSIYYSQDMDQDSQDILQSLFQKAKKGKLDTIKGKFGSMIHDFKEFKSFVPKQIYKIVVHTKGGIEVVEE